MHALANVRFSDMKCVWKNATVATVCLSILAGNPGIHVVNVAYQIIRRHGVRL